MKKTIKRRVLNALLCLFALLVFLFPLSVKTQNEGGRCEVNASAASSGDVLAVQQYDVYMNVRADRKIEVRELVTVQFLSRGLTMFYRSLPTDGARYENIQAKCEGNDEFYFYVADNEEGGAFIDVNCVGNAQQYKTWTYEITYVMEQGTNVLKDGMIIDVVGFGWMIPLNDVTVQVDFPEKPTSSKIYTDVFGVESGNAVEEFWVSDTRLVLKAERLDLVYSQKYNETVAGGITLEFTLQKGVLAGYHATRLFTKDIWKILLGGLAAIGLSVVAMILLSRKRDVVTVVNLSPPEGMDPMKMGKWIDGQVNNEDITSMIYYFANKGYLKIDFTDENDPELISECDVLPEGATPYEHTLFNALFQGARAWQGAADAGVELIPRRCMKVSEFTGNFYEASRTAMQQVPEAPKMYEKKSVFAYLSGAFLGLVLGVLMPYLIAMRIGGGYTYLLGVLFVAPLAINAFLGYVAENYRYKWKPKKRHLLFAAQLLVAIGFSCVFIFLCAEHILTGYEKVLLCLCIFAASFISSGALSRTEEYLHELENILGFKEFIVVTEEDKIKVMLEENPELYYHVLPYAQVLGVTDEWEGKFKKLLVQPPSWYYSRTELTYFDCYLLNRALTRTMLLNMARAAAEVVGKAGSVVGRSGGGGHFGGFGGGGFGGGGGGAR